MIHYMTSEGLGSPWVGNELRIVSGAGLPVVLFAMRRPATIHFTSEWAKQMHEATTPLYPLRAWPMIVANLGAPFMFGRRWFAALGNALFGERENLRARLACLAHFFVACQWATQRECEREQRPVSHIHAQWAFGSASIAMYGAWLLDVPFSFTGHAVDLTRQRVALRDKIKRAKFIIAISNWHKDFYVEADAGATLHVADKIHVAYCGIYTDEMRPAPDDQRAARAGQPFTILSAGRLIGKKGFPVLIEACRLLRERGRSFRCVIAGSGPDEAALRAQVAQAKLDDIVELTGKALQQERIPAFMHQGDCFTLACVWASDGDVDGLPQLTMEAMGCGLPAVTTRLVGNPDLVIHEKTGLLVESGNAGELADALARLMDDAALRERLARDGRQHVLDVFDIRKSLEPLLAQYRAALGQQAAQGTSPAPTGATA